MTDDDASLAGRIQRLEDELAIIRLIATYGPSVDSASKDVVASLFAPEGVYAVAEVDTFVGRDGVSRMVDEPRHRAFLANGAAHLVSLPRVEVSNDRAVAVGYSSLVLRSDDGFKTATLRANRWELRRYDDGWKVESRVSRLLDGNEEARQLLRSGITDEDPPEIDVVH